ncbi:MAG: hypothetical protein JSC085_000237 [Candidatus Tokpelaia sp. JSC085]|nr:MAG: hypothetical protein JSC085_000237 [Candidatus Tokpelaia sp. JSC085]
MVENFIHEVNKEIRQYQLGDFLRRYRFALIGSALAIVLMTIIFQIYSAQIEHKAAQIGDSFLAIVAMPDRADYAAVLIKLDEIEKSGFGAYPFLTKMYRASILAARGDKIAAVTAFDAVADNPSAPQVLRAIASVRASYLLVDTGLFTDVENRVKSFATDINPMRFSAWEALGLSAWKAGKTEDAIYYFNRICQDEDATGTGFYQRAYIMLHLIHGRQTKTED